MSFNLHESKFRIAQIVIMAALLAFIIVMLLSGNAKVVDMSVIKTEMTQDQAVKALTEKDMGEAGKTFGFDHNLVDEGIYYRVDDVMDVNELFIAKVSDDNARQTVMDAMGRYLEDKTNAFDGYGTNQFGLLSDAILEEKGEYIFFAVSEDAPTWEAEFLNSLK